MKTCSLCKKESAETASHEDKVVCLQCIVKFFGALSAKKKGLREMESIHRYRNNLFDNEIRETEDEIVDFMQEAFDNAKDLFITSVRNNIRKQVLSPVDGRCGKCKKNKAVYIFALRCTSDLDEDLTNVPVCRKCSDEVSSFVEGTDMPTGEEWWYAEDEPYK